MVKKAKTKREQNNGQIYRALLQKDPLYLIVFFGLCILMFYPPYFRGLFFDKELLPTHVFTFILFALWWIYKLSQERDVRFLQSPLDYAAMALVVAYFISIFPAANYRLAIGELLKNINYFMAFWLTGEVLKRHKDSKIFLNVLLVSILGTAILGIGALAGTFSYPGAIMGNRISSSVQYPNTLAAMLTSAYFISLTFFLNSIEKCKKCLYTVLSFILFFTFIFTYSRGAWIIFPFVAIAFLIGTVKENKIKAIENFIVVLIPTLICIPGFSSAKDSKVWLWFALGCVLTAVFYFLSSYTDRISKKIKFATVGILTIFVIIGIVIGATATKPIILEHTADEEASTKTISREIKDVKPDTDYVLKMDIESKNPDEESYSWRVAITSKDEDGRSVSIYDEKGTETNGTETIELTFKTRKDTKDLLIYFRNHHPNTYVKFDSIKLMNKKEDHEQIKIKTAYKYIPESLAKRITSIDPETMLASGRFTFYRDAFKIIKDYPIIGAGGGGWASLYFGYQSHLYWSNQVHNYFMQAWIETGTVGLLAIISIWITLFISVIRLIKVEENQQEKQEIWGIFIAALALGSHSIVDFNLSLGAVALLLWFLFGFIKGKTDGKFGTKKIIDTYKSLIKYYVASIIPCILLAVLSISLLVGYSYGQDGIQLAAAGDVVEAANSFYKASKYDPLTASYKADRGQLLNIISRSSDLESILSESEEQFKKAIALDRFNPKMHTYLGAFYLLYGDYEDGFVHLEEAVKLHPFNPTYYELLTEGYVGVAQEFIRMRHPEEAERFLNKALELIGQIQKLNKGSKQKMEITPKLILNLEKIAYMKNNLDRRSAYLDIDYITFALAEMIDTTNDDIPDLWEKVNTTDSYISTKIISRETGNYIQIRNDGKGGGYIRSEDFTLIPKQEYEITMQVKGDIQPGKIKTSIRSRTGQNTQFSATLNEVSDNWHELTFQFTTTDDIEPGKQYMRIDHAGGAGYIEIKDLYIWEN